MDTPVTVAWTGASGARYGVRLVECLLAAGRRVHLLVSRAGAVVLKEECGFDWFSGTGDPREHLRAHFAAPPGALSYFHLEEWTAPVASGSGGRGRMVVCPCSMGTLAAIAHGLSRQLIQRAADVILKERGLLILVPREAPLSAIHLENMLTLARMGVVILPAAPGFYHAPATVEELVDFVVDRVLVQLGEETRLLPSWPRERAGGTLTPKQNEEFRQMERAWQDDPQD